jgi:Putative zinc- or iron-chelating domain
MEPFDGTTWGKRLIAEAGELLADAHERIGLAQALAGLATLAGELAGTAGTTAAACRAGCPYCCVLNVTVLLPEAAAIAERLAATVPAGELAALVDRLDTQRMRVRWMDDGERVRKQIFCPFLDGAGSCTIHPFRPLVCRGVTSLDSRLCRGALDPTELDVPRSVPMDLALKMVMDDAFRALARAAGAGGMDTRGIELSAGVVAFLVRPELTGLLLAGEPLPDLLWE